MGVSFNPVQTLTCIHYLRGLPDCEFHIRRKDYTLLLPEIICRVIFLDCYTRCAAVCVRGLPRLALQSQGLTQQLMECNPPFTIW